MLVERPCSRLPVTAVQAPKKPKSSEKESLEAGPRRTELQMRISHSSKGRSIYFKGKYSGFLIKASQEIIKAKCERLLARRMCWQVRLPHRTYPEFCGWLRERGCSVKQHFNSLVFFCSPPEHLHPVLCAHCLLLPVPRSVAPMDLCRKRQLQFLLCHHVDFQRRAGEQSEAARLHSGWVTGSGVCRPRRILREASGSLHPLQYCVVAPCLSLLQLKPT